MTSAFGGQHSIQLSYGCIRGAWRAKGSYRDGHEFRVAKQLTTGLLADHARRINAEIAFSGPNSKAAGLGLGNLHDVG